MRLALSVIRAVLAGAVLPTAAQTVSDEYDRGSGERSIAYTADGSRDPGRPVLTFNASFTGDESWSGVTLAFVSAGDENRAPSARFAACHNVDWIVDGQSLASTRSVHQGSVIHGELIEMIAQDVTPAWVNAISSAQSVRYRVCRDEYALTPGDIQAFATVVAKLRSATRSTYRPGSTAAPGSAPADKASKEVGYEGMQWRPKSKDSGFR